MVRTVPPGITSALSSVAKHPAVEIIVRDAIDRPFGMFTGSGSGRSCILRLEDGSYVRAYVSQPGVGVDASVYSQLLTDVTDPVQLSAWSLRASNAAMRAGICLTVIDGTLYLLYQRRSDNAVCFQTSADGESWSAEAVASNPGCTVWGLASSGRGDLFQAQDAVPGDDSTQAVLHFAYSLGSFVLQSTWTNPFGAVSSVSAVNQDGIYRLVLGAQTRTGGGIALAALSLSAGVWSGLEPIHPIDDPALGVSIPYPFAMLENGGFLVAANLYDTGAVTGTPTQRCELWRSLDFANWYLEQTMAGGFTAGVFLAPGPAGGWLIGDASTVLLSAAAAGGSNPDVDCSASVLACEINEPASGATTASILLENHDGRWTPPASPDGAMRVGALLDISLGYGEDTVRTHRLLIERIESLNSTSPLTESLAPLAPNIGDGLRAVRVLASSRAARLSTSPPVARVYQGQTVLALCSAAAAAAGILAPVVADAASQFSQAVDSFALGPATAEPSVSGFERLRWVYGFDWFLDENEVLHLREPTPDDEAVATYDPSMPAMGFALGPVLVPNHVRAASGSSIAPAFADAIDAGAQARDGAVISRTVSDPLLGTSAQAQIRGGLALRRLARDRWQGWAAVPLNPALQPLDVVTISDPDLSATVRIEHLRWVVDLATGRFHQTLTLRAP